MSLEDQRRKFLIALNSQKARDFIQAKIEARLPGSLVVQSQDGIETLSKLSNDQPNVLIIEHGLNKKPGKEVVSLVLKNSKLATTAIIFLSAIPDDESFVDDVVLGRVHFFDKVTDELAFSKVITRALNYSSHGSKGEFHLRYLTKGEFLMHQGERGDFVYIVKVGRLQAQISNNEKTTVLGGIEPGEFVGEMAYINGEPRIADVVALTDCELIEIPVDHLDHLLFQKPAWGRALLRTLSKRVKIAAEKEAKIAGN